MTYQTRDALVAPSAQKFTSVGSRESAYGIAYDYAIRPHPLLGAGPGWFARPAAPAGAPHDIFIGELSEVGALGLLALLWFLWRVLQTTNRIGGDLAMAAWYVLLARVLASTVDIFWVAGPTTLPFMIVGLAIGANASREPGVGAPRPRPFMVRR